MVRRHSLVFSVAIGATFLFSILGCGENAAPSSRGDGLTTPFGRMSRFTLPFGVLNDRESCNASQALTQSCQWHRNNSRSRFVAVDAIVCLDCDDMYQFAASLKLCRDFRESSIASSLTVDSSVEIKITARSSRGSGIFSPSVRLRRAVRTGSGLAGVDRPNQAIG